MLVLLIVIIAVVAIALLTTVGLVVNRRRERPRVPVPPGSNMTRSHTQPASEVDQVESSAPAEVSVDAPTAAPEGAPTLAAPELGIPSPSTSDRASERTNRNPLPDGCNGCGLGCLVRRTPSDAGCSRS